MSDSHNPQAEVFQMGGQLVHSDSRCAMGVLPNAQPDGSAGPYVVKHCVPAGDSLGPMSLIAVGQVTLYNRAALLEELKQSALSPSTSCSDGELLLRFYAYAGAHGLAHVNGMFACAIWNGSELVLVRDAVGARTLFYTHSGNCWAASSSPRALRCWPHLRREINLSAVQAYLTFAYMLGEETLLADVWELLPGHALHVFPDGSHELCCYWHLS